MAPIASRQTKLQQQYLTAFSAHQCSHQHYVLYRQISLMGMTSYKRNEMDHLTYRGGMGREIRGEFTTVSKGFGDSSLTAIIGLDDALSDAAWHRHI